MIPVQFPESNAVLARDQGEYMSRCRSMSSAIPRVESRSAAAYPMRKLRRFAGRERSGFSSSPLGAGFQPIALTTERPDMPNVELKS